MEETIKLNEGQFKILQAIQNEKIAIERREHDILAFILLGNNIDPHTVGPVRLENGSLIVSIK